VLFLPHCSCQQFGTYICCLIFVLIGLREWFRWYKTPDNKPLNKFGYNEAALPRKAALEVIEETHHYWKDLRAGKTKADKLWVK